jgi:hypothetical protein
MVKKSGRKPKKITSKWTRRKRKVNGKNKMVYVRKVKGKEQVRLKK